ncbi:hypothetical protein [Comamonas terrigena]|uniref:hypothetical protein n=1 Tax=Comamonas terrigena TaxID=32013 RepID=UPI00244AD506|nr:hypothetical protein [Comamonas terrigena]MDH1701432.1 hypothetical protein [Comamonas terrigena]
MRYVADDFCEMPSREYVAAHMDQGSRRTVSWAWPLHAECPAGLPMSRAGSVAATACEIAVNRKRLRMRHSGSKGLDQPIINPPIQNTLDRVEKEAATRGITWCDTPRYSRRQVAGHCADDYL